MTLKCIAGIETPDEGQIVLNGKVLFDHKKKINIIPQDREVGMLFQSYALFPNMTLEENIKIGVKIDKINKGKTVQRIINDFSLNGLEKSYPHQLSGGQQQRTALARMIVNQPKILMLDEPFSALDEHLKFQMEDKLIDIIKNHVGEVLYVTHSKDEVFRVSDLIAVMDGGRIEELSSKSQLFERPKSVYSAILTGYKNISRAKKVNDRRVVALDWDLELECDYVGDNIKYIGVPNEALDICHNNSMENTFGFNINRIIENINSYIIILSNKYNTESPIYIEVPKNDYGNIETMKDLYIKFHRDKIVLFY